MKTAAIAFLAAASLAMTGLTSTQADAAVILTGVSATECPTTGCFDSSGSLYKTISAADFTGPTTIHSMLFKRATLGEFGGATFKVTFWVAGGAIKVGDFGSFDIAVLPGDEVTLTNFTGFEYDPAWGDLMMKVELQTFDSPGGFGGGFGGGGVLAAYDPDPPTGPPGGQYFESSGADTQSFGSTVGPFFAETAGVPEPAGWALLIVGFGGAGVLLRRRRPDLAGA